MTVVLGTGLLKLPAPLLVPILLIAGALAGAVALLGPAFLKTRFGVDEVVTTLLLNFIIVLFVSLLLEGPLKDPMGLGWPQSSKVIPEAVLPKLIHGKRLHLGFVIAIVTRSPSGSSIRAPPSVSRCGPSATMRGRQGSWACLSMR